MWKFKGPRTVQSWKKRLEESHILLSKLITELQYSKQCGSSIRMDIQIHAIELRFQKYLICPWSTDFPQCSRVMQWGKNNLFNMCHRTAGYSPANEQNWTPKTQYVQELTPNGSKT